MTTAVASEFLASCNARDWPAAMAAIERDWVALMFSCATYRQVFTAVTEAPADQLGQAPKAALIAEAIGRLPPGSVPVPVPRGPARIDQALRAGTARDLIERAIIGMVARRAGGLPRAALEIAGASRPLLQATTSTRFAPAADLAAYWHLQAGQAALHTGDLGQAMLDLGQGWSLRDDDVTGYVAPSVAPFLALLAALTGDDGGSARWQAEVDRLEPQGRSLIEWDTMERPRLVARLLEASDRLDLTAGRRLTALLLPQLAFDETWSITLFAIVRHLVDVDDATRADQIIATTAALHSSAAVPSSLHAAFVALARTEVAFALGRASAVSRLLATPETAIAAGLTSVCAARLEVAGGDLAAARRLAVVAEHQGDDRTRRESRLLRVVIDLTLGVEGAGEATACSPSLRRTASLLPPDLNARLRAAYGADVPTTNTTLAGSRTPMVRLTPSESGALEALRWSGSLADVADRLFISRNTLKSHLRTLYGKLGASSRQEALAVAGHLGLLQPAAPDTAKAHHPEG